MTKTRIIVVDDHPMVREGLRQLIQKQGDLEFVGDAIDAEGVKILLAAKPADLLLLDISLPKGDGISLAKELRILHPGLSIVFLSMHEESEFIRRGFEAGAKGYLLKSSESDEILRGIREVAKGKRYVSAQVSLHFLREEESAGSPGKLHLTEREKEILKLVAQGLSAKEIASQIDISHRTVEAHRQNLMRKLGAKNAVDLVRLASACRLLE